MSDEETPDAQITEWLQLLLPLLSKHAAITCITLTSIQSKHWDGAIFLNRYKLFFSCPNESFPIRHPR